MQELEADPGIPKTTVSEILTQDLGMKCIVAKFVMWLLLPEQKEHHAAVANDLIQTAAKKAMTGGESWVYGYDLETKAQLSQWNLPVSPHPKKVQQDLDHVNCVF